jgi:hypothetical protein
MEPPAIDIDYTNLPPSPYDAIPSQGYGGFGGNPANEGFASGASISSGAGPIVDMILNLLLSGITSKMGGGSGMPTFGRPQVSDYALRTMRERENVASEAMSGIYGNSPTSKLFGPLGDNALAQQFGDTYFQSGGSRADAFKQIFGRFGHQMGGGPGGMNIAARGAGNVLNNIDDQFTDNEGFWDYTKTAGFNRENTIKAVAEYTSQFGGKDIIETLSKERQVGDAKTIREADSKVQEIIGNKKGAVSAEELEDAMTGFSRQSKTDTARKVKEAVDRGAEPEEISRIVESGGEGNTKEIDAAGKEMTLIAETVREAGNFFGPNKPFDVLVKEMKLLADGAKSTSTAELKSSLQQVQAMAIAVDMSNEAFSNYMKVIGQINKVAGGVGSTKDLAIESMAVGKAIEESGKQKAREEGRVYTGISAEEAAIETARMIAGRETSSNAINAKVITATLGQENHPLAKEASRLMAEGDYEGVMKLFDEGAKSGEIEQTTVRTVQQKQGAIHSGKTRWTEEMQREMEKQMRAEGVSQEDIDKNKNSAGLAARSTMRGALRQSMLRDSDTVELLGGEEGVKKFSELMESGKIVSSEEDLTNYDQLKERLMKEGGYDEETAKTLASKLQVALPQQWQDEAQRRITLENLNPENAEKADKIKREQQETQESIDAGRLGDYAQYSDATITERSAKVVGGIYSDLSKDGEDVTWDKFWDIAKGRGQDELLGGEEKARRDFETYKANKVYKAEKEKLYKDAGLVESELADDDPRKQEIEEQARELAYGEDTYIGQRNKHIEEERKKLEDQAEDLGFTNEADKKEWVEGELKKKIEEEDKELGITPKEEKDGEDRRSEEDKKDEVMQNLIKALEDNTKATREASGSDGGGGSWFGWSSNEDGKVPNGD